MTPNLEHLENLQALTKEYSQFSRNRIGVGYIIFAVLSPAVFLVAQKLPLTFLGAILGDLLSVVGILLWFYLRDKIMQMQYQKFGVARAFAPLLDKEFLIGMIFGLGLGTFLVWVLSTFQIFNFPNTYIFAIPSICVAAVFAFREFKQNGELVGMATFCLGAFVGAGINSNATNLMDFQRITQQILVFVVPLGFALSGWREHQQFKQLEQKFKNLGTS
jgi:hypothetical protein